MAQTKVAQHLVNALESLRKERADVESRIATIEKIISRQAAVEKAAAKGGARRGRPPKAAAATAKKTGARRGRPPKAASAAASAGSKKKPNWSAAARAAARERMRKYWAERRRKG